MADITHVTSYNDKKDVRFTLTDDYGNTHDIFLNQEGIKELTTYLIWRIK